MPELIPLRSDTPLFDVQVSLSDIIYTLEFKWNFREAAWYMNIKTEVGDDILTGIKVVIDFPLGRRSPNPLRPAGVLIAVDTSDTESDPKWDEDRQAGDLGDRVQLLYFPPEEAHLRPTDA